MASLDEAFDKQHFLQTMVYGYNFNTMEMDERVDFIHLMTTAGVDEAHEALNETSWKPWSKGDWINEEAFKNELADELHFFINRCLAVNMSAQELLARYFAKANRNQQRQVNGYDVRTGKCSSCRRALDDVGAGPDGLLCTFCASQQYDTLLSMGDE